MTSRRKSTSLYLKTVFTVVAFIVIGWLSISCKHRVISKVSKQPSQESVYAAKLAKNIPKADRNRYYPIGQHWQNPTIFVDLSGIFIILEDQSVRQATSSINIGRDLAALPTSAWPMGRVVVFAQSSRIPILIKGYSLSEQEKEAYRIVGETIKILKSLDVDIVYAPIN